jgi:hypothetical protein
VHKLPGIVGMRKGVYAGAFHGELLICQTQDNLHMNNVIDYVHKMVHGTSKPNLASSQKYSFLWRT